MRVKKVRKPRGIKLNGHPSMDMCPHCLSMGCDRMSDSTRWAGTKSDRDARGACRACGAIPCICKSSLDAVDRDEYGRPVRYSRLLKRKVRI